MTKKPDVYCPPYVQAERARRAAERAAEKAAANAHYDETRRKEDPRLARAARIRNSKAWKQLRGWYIRRNPLCEDPLGRHGGRLVPATDVHHIYGLSDYPDRAFEVSNLSALCRSCHNAVEALERAGETVVHYFNRQS